LQYGADAWDRSLNPQTLIRSWGSRSWKMWQPKSENISFVAQFTGSQKTQDLALAIVYRNKPDQGEKARYGAAHDGACLLFLQQIPSERGAKPGFRWKFVGDYMTNHDIHGISGSTGTFTLAFHSRHKKPGKPEDIDAGAATARC
jgi:hypothetical protein